MTSFYSYSNKYRFSPASFFLGDLHVFFTTISSQEDQVTYFSRPSYSFISILLSTFALALLLLEKSFINEASRDAIWQVDGEAEAWAHAPEGRPGRRSMAAIARTKRRR